MAGIGWLTQAVRCQPPASQPELVFESEQQLAYPKYPFSASTTSSPPAGLLPPAIRLRRIPEALYSRISGNIHQHALLCRRPRSRRIGLCLHRHVPHQRHHLDCQRSQHSILDHGQHRPAELHHRPQQPEPLPTHPTGPRRVCHGQPGQRHRELT